eukprot:COSAG02_NODE_131_length_34710_cov_17.171159_4_plen_97_part_00
MHNEHLWSQGRTSRSSQSVRVDTPVASISLRRSTVPVDAHVIYGSNSPQSLPLPPLSPVDSLVTQETNRAQIRHLRNLSCGSMLLPVGSSWLLVFK